MSNDLRTWDTAIKNGLFAYLNRDKYCYFYGAKGQVMTDEQMDYFFNAGADHFAKYSDTELRQIRENSRGKIGYDCSGFTGWVCTGDKQWSTGQIENCSIVTPNLVAGVAGSLLYTTYSGAGRHIALDIGYGYCLQTAWESTDAAIAEGRDSIFLDKIIDGKFGIKWEKSGQSNVLDYTGADNR